MNADIVNKMLHAAEISLPGKAESKNACTYDSFCSRIGTDIWNALPDSFRKTEPLLTEYEDGILYIQYFEGASPEFGVTICADDWWAEYCTGHSSYADIVSAAAGEVLKKTRLFHDLYSRI